MQDISETVLQNCIPIHEDVIDFDFEVAQIFLILKALAKKQKDLAGRLFDAIIIDPPWQLSSSNPTRGVGKNSFY